MEQNDKTEIKKQQQPVLSYIKECFMCEVMLLFQFANGGCEVIFSSFVSDSVWFEISGFSPSSIPRRCSLFILVRQSGGNYSLGVNMSTVLCMYDKQMN